MVRKLYRGSGKAVAEAPGTMRFTGRQKADQIGLSVMEYDPENLAERTLATVEEAFPCRDSKPVSWVNINGLHDVELLGKLGEHFNIHPLVMEDIVNVRQRPKVEDHDGYFFIVCRMVDFDDELQQIKSEQVSLILTQNLVLSFQEQEGDVFEAVRVRIRNQRGRFRQRGADYLAYAILDAVVDHYFVVLEKLSDQIEGLEEQLLENPTTGLLEQVHGLKREMILLRRSAWPLREALNALMFSESDLIDEGTEPFLRDVQDHTIQVVEVIESFRDILSGLQDLYLSSVSNRMNEVMKVLTIAATIFVPLTFVAGIYGMNFEFMPELGWKYSYYVFWFVILVLGGGMVTYFRRRGWL
jgi:magnesium transporter